jgi:hypothetical protein
LLRRCGGSTSSAVIATSRVSSLLCVPQYLLVWRGGSVSASNSAPHPLRHTHPHLRHRGTKGAYTLSVITPRAAAGMTARECASAILRTLAERPNVPPAAELIRERLDDSTYVVMYAAQLPGFLQLNAHFLSAAAGTHCVEVHAAKMATSLEDVDPWFKAFSEARIEPD